jgi:hypothetical protein
MKELALILKLTRPGKDKRKKYLITRRPVIEGTTISLII